jgi:cytoskeleton protein RodZ
MSENLSIQDALLNPENPTENFSVAAGQMLRQARVDAGLHIAALSVTLRVPVKRIEALENGQMELLPDMVFVRALTASICQTLKIDALPILEKLPKATVPRLNRDDVALNTPLIPNAITKKALPSEVVTVPWIIGIVFLCLAAAVIYFLPKDFTFGMPEITTTQNFPESAIRQTKEQQAWVEKTEIPSQTGLTTSQPGTLPSSDSGEINSAAKTVASDISSANLTVNSVVTSPANLVVFKASSDAWVEVKNSNGSTLFKKLLKAGESASASGIPPLTVVVGRADVIQVEVRGRLIDLAQIAKNNIARFEVN